MATKPLRAWHYTEVRDADGKVRFQSLNEVEAHFFVKKLLVDDPRKPEILVYERTESESPIR